MSPRSWFRPASGFVLGALVLAMAGCRGGCARTAVSARPVGGALSWFPAETQIVVSIDFGRLRATPLGARLGSLVTSNAQDKAQIDELARRTGFDPMAQIDSLTVAFPEEARVQGAMGLVMRARGLEEARLVAYVRDQVAKQGDDLFAFHRAGRTLWATRKEATTAGFFADDRTFVLGGGGWAEKMAELGRAPAPAGAETNVTLVHLVERAGLARPLWAVAIVPATTRAALAADPTLPEAATVNRLALGVDVAAEVDVKLLADLATRTDAEKMAARVLDAVRAAKQSPQVLLLGIAPYLDGVSARAVDATCEIGLHLSQAQALDAVERLRAYLALARQGSVPGFPHP